MRELTNRVTWLLGLFAVASLLLIAQLYRLTVAETAQWRYKAQDQMVRELPSYGPRGVIYDRKGRALATSEPAFAAVLVKQSASHVEAILPKLALVLADGDQEKAISIEERVRKRVKENTGRTYQPIILERNLPSSVVATFMERRSEFPGVVLVTESARSYPQGAVAGAVVGYVGQISEEELGEEEFKGYYPDEVVGKAGLELSYEQYLRGQPGHTSLIVDPYGRPVEDVEETPAQPGHNLHLTLDLDLQRAAEEILAKQIEWIRAKNDPVARPVRGALVVQNVRTGAILADVTVPTYNPNTMVGGPSAAEWEQLQKVPGYMLNWTLQGYAPGSTYKMATGLAGLEHKVIGPYEQINCAARYWKYTNPKNWAGDQGYADVARALAISCNPFFYETGDRMGIDKLHAFVDQFGFGHKTGIDLPGEQPGLNPTRESYGDRWWDGNITSVAIGQGDVLVTPLQLANYTAAIAMNGVRYRPYLVQEIRTSSGKVVKQREPEVIGQVQARPEHWQRIRQGMRQAVTSIEGTAHYPFLGFPIPVAAKTGSAETGTGTAHGVTVAYAPYDNPEIAVSVVIENGSSGFWTAPVARRVMAKYFGIEEKVLPKEVPTYKD